MEIDSQIGEKLRQIAIPAGQLGLSTVESLEFLLKCLEQRVEVLLQFREDLTDKLAMEYLTNLLNETPSANLLAALRTKRVKVLLSDADRHTLEVRQRNKCALCGRPLHFVNNPHIDHKVPISRQGDNSIENLQILCAKCNLGKGAFFGWPLSAPFFDDDSRSAKVRFFALSRANGKCEMKKCEHTWLDTELIVYRKIRPSKGGRYVLDNLRVLCKYHAEEESEKNLRQMLTAKDNCVASFQEDEQLSGFKQNFKKLSREMF